jgi:hypothetical protein
MLHDGVLVHYDGALSSVQRLQCTQACMTMLQVDKWCLLIACHQCRHADHTATRDARADIANQSSVQHENSTGANSSIQFLSGQPAQWSADTANSCSYPQLHAGCTVRLVASIDATVSVYPCLVYAGVYAVQVQSVTRSCLGTCCQCEVLLKILNLQAL